MKEKHTHKLKRLRYKSGNIIFFCTLPDCSFKTNVSLVLGKRSLCWRCSEEFIMNEYALRLSKPHCENCHKPKITEITPDTAPIPSVIREAGEEKQLTLSERLSQIISKSQKTTEEREDEI